MLMTIFGEKEPLLHICKSGNKTAIADNSVELPQKIKLEPPYVPEIPRTAVPPSK